MSDALAIEIQCPKFEGLFVGTSHFDSPEYRGFGGSYNPWPGLDVSVILHLIDLGGSPSDLYQYVCVHARTLKAHLHGLSPDLRDAWPFDLKGSLCSALIEQPHALADCEPGAGTIEPHVFWRMPHPHQREEFRERWRRDIFVAFLLRRP